MSSFDKSQTKKRRKTKATEWMQVNQAGQLVKFTYDESVLRDSDFIVSGTRT
jgi:hypothetical protein